MTAPPPQPRDLVARPDPTPGLARLRWRVASRPELRDALLAALAEVQEPAGGPLGGQLDVAGDPTVAILAELWSRVADSVAAYTELTAGERYLGTAQDWTDLRRTVDLLGYRPSQRTAAHGFIRVTSDAGASPVVPAGTRVQAPAAGTTPAQTYEVVADTALRPDWAELVVTGVPQPAAPTGNDLRLLEDPGFAASDRILLVAEAASSPPPTDWSDWLAWLASLLIGTTDAVIATVTVTKRSTELGAFVITMDRPLDSLLAGHPTKTYAAYRIRATLELAHRLTKISYISGTAAATADVSYPGEPAAVGSKTLLVKDAIAASPGMGIVVSNASGALVTSVASVASLDWSIAPGTTQRVGVITVTDALPLVLQGSDIDVHLVDARRSAQHYELPPLNAGQTRLRIHPRPLQAPPKLAVETTTAWEVADCSIDAGDSALDTGGMLLSLANPFIGTAAAAPATANLVPVQHGTTNTATLTLADQVIVAGPVTADVGTGGQVVDSLQLRVGGVAFDEVASLYAQRPDAQVYSSKLAADGRMVLSFGDGITGARPRGDITATWRIGGGLDGEINADLITTLLGSVKGVRKIAGVGHLTGAADQEDPLRVRRAAAARIRALDRAVSLADLADLALTVPGTSHAISWRGQGPAGCPCGGTGLHVAALRLATTGVRVPQPAELLAMAAYLDARRDTTVPLCVCAGYPSALDVTVRIATDPSRDAATVRDAVSTALLDPGSTLAAQVRDLGEPLDISDLVVVAQQVAGVVGIVDIDVSSGLLARTAGDVEIGRTPAARFELLSVGTATVVTT
jgi:hypothetical protein